MKCIPRFDDFPFGVRQADWWWCTFANVEAVTCYHVPDSKINQNALSEVFISACNARMRKPESDIGLLSYTEPPLSTHEDLAWSRTPKHFPASDFKTFEDLIIALEKGVDDGLPYIISVPSHDVYTGQLNGNKHMFTVVGYDDEHLRVFDSLNNRYARYSDAYKSSIRKGLTDIRQDTTDALLLRPKSKS